MRKFCYACFFLILLTVLGNACKKKEVIGEDPYAGGKEPFGISFAAAAPVPASGPAGSEVSFQVNGALKWKDSITFYLNGEKAQILEVSDNTIRVKVPDNVSSGIATIQINNQVFFGPKFSVIGKVSIDEGFNTTSTNAISGFLAVQDYSTGYLLVGGNTITVVDKQGNLLSGALNSNILPIGTLYSVSRFPAGKFIISGNITSYRSRYGNANYIENNIGNITRIKDDGTLDDTVVRVVNLTPELPLNALDTVPLFNGGTQGGSIVKSFITSDNKIIAVGNFSNYRKIDYANSTRNTRNYIITPINSVMRMDQNGKLDSSYNFNVASANAGASGQIYDAILQTSGQVVIVGSFAKFNDVTVNNIVRLDATGNVDPSFNTGTGANGQISTLTYNPTQKKFMLTGNFTTFNNISCNGVVMLDENGNVNSSFKFGSLTGGTASYSKVLNNGFVLVSGNFTKYNNITRAGFLLLNPAGEALQAYNVPGSFRGQIAEVIETTSSFGNPALVLVGYITRFDDRQVRNIVRVEIKN